MAIDVYYFRLLHAVIEREFTNRMAGQAPATACLSYPDLLVSLQDIEALVGQSVADQLVLAKYSEEVRRVHGLSPTFGPLYETDSLLTAMGLQATYFDIAKIRGRETILDLNFPLPQHLIGTYDLVIDTGTLEHCFNVGVAFKSMCDLVKVGGCVVSMAPLTIVNHGFWSFNPTCYFDGLTQNGFSLMLLQARTKSEAGATFVDFLPSPTARRHVPDGAVLMCAAKKLKAKTFEWPVQSKYLPLKGR